MAKLARNCAPRQVGLWLHGNIVTYYDDAMAFHRHMLEICSIVPATCQLKTPPLHMSRHTLPLVLHMQDLLLSAPEVLQALWDVDGLSCPNIAIDQLIAEFWRVFFNHAKHLHSIATILSE